MKLVYQPTLFDLQGMLGDRTYIDFVWLWRNREHETMSRDRIETWRAKMPYRSEENSPKQAVARAKSPVVELVSASPPSVVAALPLKPRPAQIPEPVDANIPAPPPSIAAPFPAVLEYPPSARSRRRAGGPF